MRYAKFLMLGISFGILLIKAEVVSWFRIQEMFLFDAFHMYGVIGSAIAVGAISIQLIKKFNLKSIEGEPIVLNPKPLKKVGNLVGGICFGFGWALTGACPAPLFAITGAGYSIMILAIIGATIGTFVYGLVEKHLPS
ncbi:MAG: YeeE/YedE thiosulfate transporter family protein [Salibacteraceae bacterium]|nr:YeeE/YedE thiosulfate transporter family protein [Salibacteraceae bacterium]